ncbi:MAG: 50S ribosomal protein L32 [candidate division TA06 bacterium ADurb.Bin417]|uniref:Large ribosomal subunit protein bL32 n=1 Tax=candidate division TA06 bacterium ADurb.Bin417 TaxID=1852828 RepID=A0A1V5M5W2_UNCT6|nr:MAG: 50S ribosomal protein L32 [candidate division TA06 bacterium ADurb.Bin417]
MPNPFRKHSHSRGAKRRSANRLKARGTTLCANCNEPILSHRVCPSCGYYRGKPALIVKTKKEKKA